MFYSLFEYLGLVFRWGNAFYRFEYFIEIGKAIETTFIGNIGNLYAIFSNHFTGLTNPNFVYKLYKGLLCPRFEVAAEGMFRHT